MHVLVLLWMGNFVDTMHASFLLLAVTNCVSSSVCQTQRGIAVKIRRDNSEIKIRIYMTLYITVELGGGSNYDSGDNTKWESHQSKQPYPVYADSLLVTMFYVPIPPSQCRYGYLFETIFPRNGIHTYVRHKCIKIRFFARVDWHIKIMRGACNRILRF